MPGPAPTIDTNPELAFVDVDLVELRRALKATGEWSRALVAGCLEFVAAVQDDDLEHRKNSNSRVQYRAMLRRLVELEATPPPTSKRGRRPGTLTEGRPSTSVGRLRRLRHRRPPAPGLLAEAA